MLFVVCSDVVTEIYLENMLIIFSFWPPCFFSNMCGGGHISTWNGQPQYICLRSNNHWNVFIYHGLCRNYCFISRVCCSGSVASWCFRSLVPKVISERRLLQQEYSAKSPKTKLLTFYISPLPACDCFSLACTLLIVCYSVLLMAWSCYSSGIPL